MKARNVIFLSVPALRPCDVSKEVTPTLYSWANHGVFAELVPTFPCVTSCVQASMWTGTAPNRHGVIANGFYHRDCGEVEFWVGRNNIIEGEQVWDVLSPLRGNHGERQGGVTSAVWHAQNIKECGADFIITPAPIHEDDGSTKLWCYSKPDGLYQRLLDELGHFPLQHYWGPLASIESTRWILRAAAWLVKEHAPRFHWIYIPHLDYASQKHGPNSEQARAALAELDAELARFAQQVSETTKGAGAAYLVAGEYAMTDVVGALFPNRVLRGAGLLDIEMRDGFEYLVPGRCRAFAMVDHQLAHVFVGGSDSARAGIVRKLTDLFRAQPGVAHVYAGHERREIGMDHERSGDVILVAGETQWFAYYWWDDDALAPPFARTVDIHRKPGYDPVELFFDPATKSIPLNAALVGGSHGVPVTSAKHRTALICSAQSPVVQAERSYRDRDLKRICLELLGIA